MTTNLLDVFNKTKENSIAPSTIKRYKTYYKQYMNFIPTVQGADPPLPITLKNFKLFLARLQLHEATYNTMCAAIVSIRYYCKINGWTEALRSEEISQFRKGYKRQVLGGWSSTTFLRYTQFNDEETAEEIQRLF